MLNGSLKQVISLFKPAGFPVSFSSFGVSFSFHFGKMNFGPQMPINKRGINNDDLPRHLTVYEFKT
jgi:hypothetical protein